MAKEIFILTADHMRLLRRAFVQWQDCETGAPEIDPKRPYGNSDVAHDVAEILGWVEDRNEELSEEQEDKAFALHRETEVALQILIQNAGITVPQTFVTESDCMDEDYGKWKPTK